MSLTIEKLHNDLITLNQRKEQAVQNFHQVIGAISIVEQMIHRIMHPEAETEAAPESQAAVMDVLPVENQENGEAHDQATEQVA